MTDLQTVLVVIPTLNEEAHIESCLRALVGDIPAESQPDVVVADGGSSDATRAIVERLQGEFPRLHLLDNPERLQSAGINRAVDTYAGPQHQIMVRCDAHSSYPQNFIADLQRCMQDKGAASVVIPMDATGTTAFGRAAAWVVDTKLGSGGSAHRGGQTSGYVDHGHHAAFDLAWFRKLGGYDASFSHNEDAEYDRRLTEAGGKIWMEVTVRIAYHMRPSLSGLARQYRNYGRGRARTIAKHKMRPRLRQLVPVINFVGMILCVIGSFITPWLLVWPLCYGLALLGASVLAARDLRHISGLWAGPALAAMHNAWAWGFLIQFSARAKT